MDCRNSGTTYASDNNNGGTILKPGGTLQGDLMIGFTTSYYAYVSISTFTLIAQKLVGSHYVRLYYKIATASEASSYTVSGSSGGKCKASIVSYYNDYDTTDLIDTYSNVIFTGSTNTLIAASTGVTYPLSPLIFCGFAYRVSSTTFTKPTVPNTTWVEDTDNGDVNSDYYHCYFHMPSWESNGLTGNMSATMSATLTAKHAIFVALTPIVKPLQPRRRLLLITHL